MDKSFDKELSINTVNKHDLFKKWGVDSCKCIGYYHYDEERKVYLIDDLRKLNFASIPYYPGDKKKNPIQIMCSHGIKGAKLNDYYIFTWNLSHSNKDNPYEIIIDFDKKPRSIQPRWFVDNLFNDCYNDNSRNSNTVSNYLDTLRKQLSAEDYTFIYELLQNANDYPIEGKKVDVEFNITNNYLLFLHSGEKFNVRNISGICGINEKEKTANKKTIGYKGIGFKTVFKDNSYVYIKTGEYSFRFDEGAEKIERDEAPWPILPVWTEYEDVEDEVSNIFDGADKKFKVKIAMRPDNRSLLHEGRNSYEKLLRETFKDSNVILFIPNINSVRVVINGEEKVSCSRGDNKWIVGEYSETLAQKFKEMINDTITKNKNSRIPEKYENFDCTKVSFACLKENKKLIPIKKATLYCYLPTKASWGLPFLMNTDMIPTGDRNDIEKDVQLIDGETNFNNELSSVAGAQLFSWIKDLLTSKKYDLGSIFSLIPDFDDCIEKHGFYENIIRNFRKAFEKRVTEEEIVPIKGGYATIKEVIYDKTGLSASGIMTDNDFIRFVGMDNYYLPLPCLREEKNFKGLLNHYVDEDQIFDYDCLINLIDEEDFQRWLQKQKNNNNFLAFLLKKGCLKDFLGEKIFLGADGELYEASDLFYDVDKYLTDLKYFKNYIDRLSPATRQYFKGNRKWREVTKEVFAEFDCNGFVDNILLSSNNIETVKEKLKDKDTSIHFFKFLAENVDYCNKYSSLPFISDRNEIVDDFKKDFLFLTSDIAHKVFDMAWLRSVEVAFISPDYVDATIAYFKKNFNVQDFSDNMVVEDIILSEDYVERIKDDINEDYEINKSFVDYCYANKTLFKAGNLRYYPLGVYDNAESYQWCLAEDNIFFSSEKYDKYAKKEWLNVDWMYSLDEDYFDGVGDKEDFKKFIKSKFGVKEISNKNFYSGVVKAHLKDIFDNTSGQKDVDGSKNIDFVHYLDENYKLIFEEEKDYDKFGNFKPLSNVQGDESLCDLSLDNNIYIYNEELKALLGNTWFPEDLISLCNEEYGVSHALLRIGCKEYKFGEFYDDVIVKNLDSINAHIQDKETSIAFHSFIIDHINQLTPEQLQEMVNAKVFLCGNDESPSTGKHKILTKYAQELSDKKLVALYDLDIINPEYEPEKHLDYWEERLGYTKFDIKDFIVWINDNIDNFSKTLQDYNLNKDFWRWVKDNIKEENIINDLPMLPILLKDESISNDSQTIYFSDEYMGGAGIENLVKKYDKKALFLSPLYIERDNEVEEWKTFWLKVGIKYNIVDILIKTIIPQLAGIKVDGLPKFIADNRDELEKHYGDKLISKLTELRVRGRDGNFYEIKESIYIDHEENQEDEPFPYIVWPNQILFNTDEECKLVKEIITEAGGTCITTINEWRQQKIDRYLEMQSDDSESIRNIHYQFINELAVIRNAGEENLKDIEHIEKIHLLNREDEFCEASTLTMSSVYKPSFDFESCDIKTLNYTNDDYISNCQEDSGKLFRIMEVHCDFQEEDVKLLENRKCAIYFWSQYIKNDRNFKNVDRIISEHLLDNVLCIPLEKEVKAPHELYYGEEVNKYVGNLEDWENKIPFIEILRDDNKNVLTLFDKLPFRHSLDFLDALYALINVKKKEKRAKLLSWMIDDYDESYDDKIEEYRSDENAKWYNNKNELIRIKELYALDNSDKSLKVLENHQRIINNAYFPRDCDLFKKACEILKIDIITKNDLKTEPERDSIYEERNDDLELYALVIAGIMGDADGWQELYEGYKEKLATMTLHKCRSIKISYSKDESINLQLGKFYNEDNDFYFVNSLDDKKVFIPFVDAYIDFLKINRNDININLIMDIMDGINSAVDIIKGYNTLMIDNKFKEALDELCPGIKQKLHGKEADETETEASTPGFTSIQERKTDQQSDSDGESSRDDEFDNGIEQEEKEIEEGDNDIENEEVENAGSTNDHVKSGKATGGNVPNGPTHQRPPSPSKPPQKPHRFTQEGSNSNWKPLPLDSLPPTKDEIDVLGRYGISPEQIADTNYLAQLRLYEYLKEKGMKPVEKEGKFIKNAKNVSNHLLEDGRYIHACSAARGVMYISPSVWNKVMADKWIVCVYLDGQGKNFYFIDNKQDFLTLVEKDDIIIKITGKEKVNVVNELYSGLLKNTKGTAYTLIRVKGETSSNAIFAPYVGEMAEPEDGNDNNEY